MISDSTISSPGIEDRKSRMGGGGGDCSGDKMISAACDLASCDGATSFHGLCRKLAA